LYGELEARVGFDCGIDAGFCDDLVADPGRRIDCEALARFGGESDIEARVGGD
jgi:hypothetical protein